MLELIQKNLAYLKKRGVEQLQQQTQQQMFQMFQMQQ